MELKAAPKFAILKGCTTMPDLEWAVLFPCSRAETLCGHSPLATPSTDILNRCGTFISNNQAALNAHA